jgi:hypothetical protein
MIKIPDTLQEVFNIVSAHLLTQIKRSIKRLNSSYFSACAYRGNEGLKCAAGVLIPDEQYEPEMECKFWDELVKANYVENKFVEEIAELQFIHDSNSEETIDYLKTELIKFAKLHNLTHTIEE